MTRHRLAAGLYAPLRVILYEDETFSSMTNRQPFSVNLTTNGFRQSLAGSMLRWSAHCSAPWNKPPARAITAASPKFSAFGRTGQS